MPPAFPNWLASSALIARSAQKDFAALPEIQALGGELGPAGQRRRRAQGRWPGVRVLIDGKLTIRKVSAVGDAGSYCPGRRAPGTGR